jgi:hypothetical protein
VTWARASEPEPGATPEARLPCIAGISLAVALSISLWAVVGLAIYAAL